MKIAQCEDGYLMSQSAIADRIGINQQTVSKTEKIVIAKLKATALDKGLTYDDLSYLFKQYLNTY